MKANGVSAGAPEGRGTVVGRAWSVATGALSKATAAATLVLRGRAYRVLAFSLFAVVFAFYAVTLPAAYTGGYVGWVSLRQLDLRLGFFAFALSALLSLVLTMNVYALRHAARAGRGKSLSAGAVLASVLPSSLCCTSVVPSLLAIAGASTPQIFGFTGRIQGFFATYETAILGLALVLLVGGFHLASRNLHAACPVTDGE